MKRFSPLILLSMFIASCATTSPVESPEIEPFSFDGDEPILDKVEKSDMNTKEEEQYHLHTGADDEFLYIVVDVRSRALQRQIEDYGFTLEIESENQFLGLTYPMGMIEALREVPGAAVNYIMDPSWENMPQNESTVEQARNDMRQRAMLTQSADDSPSSISITELEAQTLLARMDDEQGFYSLSYRIPLTGGRNQQFSPEALPGEALSIEVDISPPSAEDLTGEELTRAGGDVGGDMMGGIGDQQQGQGQEQEEMSEADRVDRALSRGYSSSFYLQIPGGEEE